MLLYTRRAPPKPSHHRSRNGCAYCKLKRKKCDEARPKCSRCVQKGEECIYEEMRPRELKRVSVNRSSTLRDSESPASSDSLWDYPNDCWHDFNAQNYSSTSVGFWTEDLDYSADQISDFFDSPMFSGSEWPTPEYDMGVTFNYSLPDLDSSVFMEFAEHRHRRALIDHFCNILSHLLVFRENTGNPFRQLILPISHASSPVLDILLAFSSSHLEHKGVQSEEKSLYFHNKALQGLAKLIEDFEYSNKEEVLSTIMLLVYHEALVRQSDAKIINDHLKAAMMIIRSMPKPQTPVTSFLERAFCFFDIIVALSFDQPPLHSPPSEEIQSSILHDFESGNSILDTVDILLGLFVNLWPIIHRLSNLRSSKLALDAAIATGNLSKVSVLRTEFESTSRGIELALMAWKPPTPLRCAASDSLLDENRMQSIVNNAEAYRCSALVYLYHEVNLYPTSSPSVQKWTRLSLFACSNVIDSAQHSFDGPMSALLWPLFTASCNAIDQTDRDLARNVFVAIDQRQGMRNIVDAWAVVEEVWRRVDLAEWTGSDEVNWRDICQERGLNIVFG